MRGGVVRDIPPPSCDRVWDDNDDVVYIVNVIRYVLMIIQRINHVVMIMILVIARANTNTRDTNNEICVRAIRTACWKSESGSFDPNRFMCSNGEFPPEVGKSSNFLTQGSQL